MVTCFCMLSFSVLHFCISCNCFSAEKGREDVAEKHIIRCLIAGLMVTTYPIQYDNIPQLFLINIIYIFQ